MMLQRGSTILAVLVVLSAGCAPSPSPAPREPAGQAGSIAPVGSLRLGHYSSRDGLVGFVLDRTGPTPKVRIDGEDRVYELEIIRSSRYHTDLVSHERHIGISVATDGPGMTFSAKGRGEQTVVRDGDAATLSAR